MRQQGELRTLRAGNILRGRYWQIIYGSWTMRIIGVGIATLIYEDGQLSGRHPSLGYVQLQSVLPFCRRVMKRFSLRFPTSGVTAKRFGCY